MSLGLIRDDAARIKSIAFLEAFYPNPEFGTFSVGTGCLIAPRLVLTAGHVVYDAFQGGQANRVRLTFGGPSFLTAESTRVDFPPQWRAESDAAFAARIKELTLVSGTDCGVIILPEPVDRFVPVMPFRTASDTTLAGTLLNVFGFPVDPNNVPGSPAAGLPRGTAFGRSFNLIQGSALPAEVQQTDDYRLYYPVATVGGLSGAPVYDVDENNSRVVRGVHTSALEFRSDGRELASALRIDDRINVLLLEWIKMYGGA